MNAFSLPPQYSQILQGFDAQLQTLEGAIATDPASVSIQMGQAVLNDFSAQVQPLEAEALPESQRSRFRSALTEMHRQVRLLQTDLLFWANARQSATAKQRQQQLCDRLQSLRGYCTALLQ